MAGQATAFRRGARSVRRQMWWKNNKILGLSVLVALVLLWIILAQFCGAGLRCGSKSESSSSSGISGIARQAFTSKKAHEIGRILCFV
ncbi:hypothetical protein MPER_09980 [Moniliophthora perniciosa FA553]|nr:hypothetical protein MPER_09980 [Moniliophthora perniciosa FA553]